MPEHISTPGVYIQELNSNSRNIAGVTTSMAVFIGRCKWGPVNQPVLCRSYTDFSATFSTDSSQGDLPVSVRLFFINGGISCYIIRLAKNAFTSFITLPSSLPPLTITAKYPGEYGNYIRLDILYPPAASSEFFNIKLYRVEINPSGLEVEVEAETWNDLSLDKDDPRFIRTIVDSKWVEITVPDDMIRHNDQSGLQVPSIALSGGEDGIPPDITDYAHSFSVLAQTVEVFNLLVLPGDRERNDGIIPALWKTASEFCKQELAFLLLDPPDEWDTIPKAIDPLRGVEFYRNGVEKAHGAVFFPKIEVKEKSGIITTGPAGAIAGLIARTDLNRGVWKAPAGTAADLRGIYGVQLRLTDLENSLLNPRGINAIRLFPNNIVNWGSRTLDGDDVFNSEWKYIPVKRTALYIEQTLAQGLKWTVFEPNDEPLWSQIRLSAGAFLHKMFREGAFQGQSAKEAYFVKCDRETTTQQDIIEGHLNLVVGYAPLKPAEFIIIQIQLAGGTADT